MDLKELEPFTHSGSWASVQSQPVKIVYYSFLTGFCFLRSLYNWLRELELVLLRKCGPSFGSAFFTVFCFLLSLITLHVVHSCLLLIRFYVNLEDPGSRVFEN